MSAELVAGPARVSRVGSRSRPCSRCVMKTRGPFLGSPENLYVGMELFMNGNFVHIQNTVCEKNSSVNFCYGFPGPKPFWDLRETGPRLNA